MENCSKVYKHTNKFNGKIYVGKTDCKNVEDRWGKNGYGYKPSKGKTNHFWNSICKYTWDGFKHEILHDNLTYNEACELERYYIKEWDLMNPDKGYNQREGGEGGKLSDETKVKISKAHKGKFSGKNNPMYDVHRYGEDNPMYGKKHNEETKNKIKEKRKLQITTKETRIKMSIARKGKNKGKDNPMYGKGLKGENHPFFGKHHTDETKKKIGDAQRGEKNYNYNKHGKDNKSSKPVICIETNEIFYSITDAALSMGLDGSAISKVCLGKLKSTGNYHFEYYKEKNNV